MQTHQSNKNNLLPPPPYPLSLVCAALGFGLICDCVPHCVASKHLTKVRLGSAAAKRRVFFSFFFFHPCISHHFVSLQLSRPDLTGQPGLTTTSGSAQAAASARSDSLRLCARVDEGSHSSLPGVKVVEQRAEKV